MASQIRQSDINRIKYLRIDGGKSIKEIALITGFSKATVSKYCSGLRENNKSNPSNEAAALANKKIWEDRKQNVIAKAKKYYEENKNFPDFKSFIALYWAEGSKRSTSNFCFTNSDPGMIVFVYEYLKTINYDPYVIISAYENQNSEIITKSWNDIGINIEKVNLKKMRSKHKLYSKNGVAKVYVRRSFEIYHSMITWIHCWRQELKTPSCGWQL